MIDIIEDLSELNIPIYVEGDAPATLPDKYFTINEDYSSDAVSADNQATQIVFEFTLKYYTIDASNLYSGLKSAMTLLKSKNYITTGEGYANRTYKDKWFSRQCDVKKIEYITQ